MRTGRSHRSAAERAAGERHRRTFSRLLAALVALPCFAAVAAAGTSRDRFDVVVIDAGHGGHDQGARGSGGLTEKDLVLDVSHRLAERLRARGLQVVLTRDDDTFVPLEQRTSVANDARGDLFISIHANASPSATPRGIETYFASLESSDDAASRAAERENDAFASSATPPAAADPLMALLGDMIATEHMHESSDFAKLVQNQLARLRGGASRGVKQAPFVVLMGVQMPASLIEIGFVSNSAEARALQRSAYRDKLVEAVAQAVTVFGKRYDAKRGVPADFSALN